MRVRVECSGKKSDAAVNLSALCFQSGKRRLQGLKFRCLARTNTEVLVNITRPVSRIWDVLGLGCFCFVFLWGGVSSNNFLKRKTPNTCSLNTVLPVQECMLVRTLC